MNRRQRFPVGLVALGALLLAGAAAYAIGVALAERGYDPTLGLIVVGAAVFGGVAAIAVSTLNARRARKARRSAGMRRPGSPSAIA
jgi:hypothetical protein